MEEGDSTTHYIPKVPPMLDKRFPKMALVYNDVMCYKESPIVSTMTLLFLVMWFWAKCFFASPSSYVRWNRQCVPHRVAVRIKSECLWQRVVHSQSHSESQVLLLLSRKPPSFVYLFWGHKMESQALCPLWKSYALSCALNSFSSERSLSKLPVWPGLEFVTLLP